MATGMELCYHRYIHQFNSESIFVFLASSQASKSYGRYSKTDDLQANGRDLREDKEGEEEEEEEEEEEKEEEEEPLPNMNVPVPEVSFKYIKIYIGNT